MVTHGPCIATALKHSPSAAYHHHSALVCKMVTIFAHAYVGMDLGVNITCIVALPYAPFKENIMRARYIEGFVYKDGSKIDHYIETRKPCELITVCGFEKHCSDEPSSFFSQE
jgi:hypothetical protein